MRQHISTASEFLAARGARAIAEPVPHGRGSDWLVEVGASTVLIEEKASTRGLSRRMLDRAAIQLDAASIHNGHALRVLWLSATGKEWVNNDIGAEDAGSPVSNQFFQSHPGIDGVANASGGRSDVHAELVANPYSPRRDQLTESAFAGLFAPLRAIHPDFPREAISGSVSGVQPKLLLKRSGAGTYALLRRSVAEVRKRFEAADNIVTQLNQYFLRKQREHPEWSAEKNLDRIRLGLQAKAIEGKWPFSPAEQRWIMDRLRERCCNDG